MTTRPAVCGVRVVIPARDEEARIGACLQSVGEAVHRLSLLRPDVDARVVVVLDSCTDRTGQVVAGFPFADRLDIRAGRVGAARAAGVGDPAGPERWIACTDADSTVPGHWLTAQILRAEAGADAVVGTVEPDLDLPPEYRAEWLARHDFAAAHGHVFGANLGFRLSAYVRAGGFADVAEHEDVDLIARMRAAGAVVWASDAARVRTSGRLVGRTPGGMAGYLRRIDQRLPTGPALTAS